LLNFHRVPLIRFAVSASILLLLPIRPFMRGRMAARRDVGPTRAGERSGRGEAARKAI
jgi:hypothetical protein